MLCHEYRLQRIQALPNTICRNSISTLKRFTFNQPVKSAARAAPLPEPSHQDGLSTRVSHFAPRSWSVRPMLSCPSKCLQWAWRRASVCWRDYGITDERCRGLKIEPLPSCGVSIGGATFSSCGTGDKMRTTSRGKFRWILARNPRQEGSGKHG